MSDADSRTVAAPIAGLEAIRGLAAVYVVLNHVFERAYPGYPVDHAPFWSGWFIYGRFAVDVFIVLSGFSLALGPARRGWELGDLRDFAQRRMRRILPAYWAALALSLVVAWLIVPQTGQGRPDAASALVNGLLIQNIVGAPSPNRAFWSLAVEAQLYLLFPVLVFWSRRWGATAMLAAVALVVAIVGIAGPHIARIDTFVVQSAPDLAALFAIGVVAAGIVARDPSRRPWHWFALAALAPVLALVAWRGSEWTLDNLYWVDLAAAPAIACLLVALASARPRPLVRLLETWPLRRLGSASYSLYLIHLPILVVVYDRIVRNRIPSGNAAFLVLAAIVLPLTIFASQVFARCFERPFQRRHRSRPAPRRTSAIVDPRPT
jgi:peptidoglycan/LPS O-acetylase OafA/YrhL